MAYIEPKTDWNETYTPTPSDLNRIEGNIVDNRAEIVEAQADILEEESARIAADSVLEDYVDSQVASEASARIAGDNTKQPSPTTSSDSGLTDYPIGTNIIVDSASPAAVNSSVTVRVNAGSFTLGGTGTILSGVWRARGYASPALLLQRVS